MLKKILDRLCKSLPEESIHAGILIIISLGQDKTIAVSVSNGIVFFIGSIFLCLLSWISFEGIETLAALGYIFKNQ